MSKELFVCIECGFESPKWMGRCTSCGAWNTFKIFKKEPKGKTRKARDVKIEKIGSYAQKLNSENRIPTGFKELDRVLGGGLVRGEVVLVGGEPGIGKTTLLLELLYSLMEKKVSCLYVSAEESSSQITIHAQ
ncbi:MAG: ATPase domain-containing protein, partial [Atribacterota bacterium]|nr:ATPase domain-containing protein [Atribacterota bacterium]